MSPNVKKQGGDIPDILPGIKESRPVKRDEIFERHFKPFGFPQHIVNRWRIIPEHFLTIYITYLTLTNRVPVSVLLFELFWIHVGGIGITVGCHRYWCHKTFKAKLPLQYMLMAMNSISHQYTIHKWCLDHRIHHKYTDTDADPHNSKRGFWYCHMGWLFVPRSKEFLEVAKRFEMPDLESDPVVRFQAKYYWTLTFIFDYLIPIAITSYFWEMSLFHAFCSNARRYVISLHGTWSVNSIAHMFGDKPYDKSITANDNPLVALISVGEGWHNYHHTFPWDYKASEFGAWKINPSTLFINFMASIGWAYDLKTVSQTLLKQRLQRTGKNSPNETGKGLDDKVENPDSGNDFEYNTPSTVTEWMKQMDKPAWGWDDDSLPDEFRNVTTILRPER